MELKDIYTYSVWGTTLVLFVSLICPIFISESVVLWDVVLVYEIRGANKPNYSKHRECVIQCVQHNCLCPVLSGACFPLGYVRYTCIQQSLGPFLRSVRTKSCFGLDKHEFHEQVPTSDLVYLSFLWKFQFIFYWFNAPSNKEWTHKPLLDLAYGCLFRIRIISI